MKSLIKKLVLWAFDGVLYTPVLTPVPNAAAELDAQAKALKG